MKVNEEQHKTALHLRTTPLMCAEKICKSKATDAQTFMCAGLHLLSTSKNFLKDVSFT